MSCTLNYVFPASSKNIFLSDTDCTTYDEDENVINLKFIVSFAKSLEGYFLATYNTIIFWFFLEG